MTIAIETAPRAVTPAQNRAAAPAVDRGLAAGMIFAGILIVIAIFAVLASPPPTVDALASMALIGP
jgi:hypothetical protein